MSKLIKEQVLAQFSAAYQARYGQEPSIEQNGSWFKVNGEQSIRLAGLAQMAEQLLQLSVEVHSPAMLKQQAITPPQSKGLKPKALWRLTITQGNKLPRGF